MPSAEKNMFVVYASRCTASQRQNCAQRSHPKSGALKPYLPTWSQFIA